MSLGNKSSTATKRALKRVENSPCELILCIGYLIGIRKTNFIEFTSNHKLLSIV